MQAHEAGRPRDDDEVQTLSVLLGRMREAGSGDTVELGEVVESIGIRSFGPLLLATALVIVTPLSGIPGLSSFCAILMALVAVQMVVGRRHVWIPGFLARRSVSRTRFHSALEAMAPVARRIDRVLRPRLVILTRGPFGRILAAACLAIALVIPTMEFVPFSSSVCAAIICLFALALSFHDGALALVGFLLLGVAAYFGLGLIL